MKVFLKVFVAAFLFSFLMAGGKEAEVTFKKMEKKVRYQVVISEPFKINKAAPFKFQLKKNAKDILKSVGLKEFSENGKGLFSYESTSGETDIYYWFIACMYKGDQVSACKTFTAKEKIK